MFQAPIIPPAAPPIILRLPTPKLAPKDPEIIRETPPDLPGQIPQKIITIPASGRVPLPPRKLVVIKPPPIADKAHPIEIDRWVAPQVPERVVKYIPAPPIPQYPTIRNEILECEAPRVTVDKVYRDLGVSVMNTRDVGLKFKRFFVSV